MLGNSGRNVKRPDVTDVETRQYFAPDDREPGKIINEVKERKNGPILLLIVHCEHP